MLTRSRFLLAAALVLCALGAPLEPRAQQARIVNGLVSHGYPTTGALLFDRNGQSRSALLQCSGTLIGCNTFLTAAHCVIDDASPSHYFVFLQHAGIFAVDAVIPHPEYRSATFPLFDVAVLHLSSTVTGIDPTTVNDTDPAAHLGQSGMIVGFGQTLGTAGDYGIKRAGLVTTESCDPAYMPAGATDDTEVCWVYAQPVGEPGTDSNTCNGDSGGPLLMDFGSGQVVAGVTSGGANGNCNTTDHSYDANVYAYRAFINEQLGSDSTAACGSFPAVDTAGTSVIGYDGTLGSTNQDDSYTINLSDHANALRFALNAEDNASLNADVYVRYGAPATPTSYTCKADGSGNFGACSFELPAAGDWYALVRRTAGSGDYQLTATVFGGSQPVCGNGSVETGEDCDGADDAACRGLCGPTCACPPPFCGNGVTEIGEECDGASNASCVSGACASSCTCVAACGDGRCDDGETAAGCPQDCGCAAPGACPYRSAPGGCYCDPDCIVFGDCCPDACTACDACTAGCGNGLVETGEDCDDGNTVGGDCCSATCSFEAAGSACDDGTGCTTGDRCDAQGSCAGQAQIATGCFVADKSTIKIDDVGVAGRDRMKWNWIRNAPLALSDLGNPASETVYDFCVFDQNAGRPSLAVAARVDAGPRWSPRLSQGWIYADSGASSDGVQKLALLTGKSAKVKLKARGVKLSLPGPVSESYFAQDPGVVTQLRNSAGKCWTATVSSSIISNKQKFVGKTP